VGRVTATKNSATRTFGVRRLCRRLTVQPTPPKRSRVDNSATPPVAASFSWAIRRCLSSLTLPLRFGFRCPPERGAPSAPTRDLSSIATAPSPRLRDQTPCHSERSEESAFYDPNARSLAKQTRKRPLFVRARLQPCQKKRRCPLSFRAAFSREPSGSPASPKRPARSATKTPTAHPPPSS
jgi:hypothetical protein